MLTKFKSMIDYFDVLDSAGVESEEISMQEIPISNLREDKYIPFDEKLIQQIKQLQRNLCSCTKDVLMNLKISALEFVQEVQNGNISAEDFVAKSLERIQSVDEKLHAFLSVNEEAVDQAREIDKKIKSGRKSWSMFWNANFN